MLRLRDQIGGHLRSVGGLVGHDDDFTRPRDAVDVDVPENVLLRQRDIEITGADDSDEWTGAKIKLVVAMVDFQGKRVPAIRIEAPKVAVKAKPKPLAADEQIDDSDIPF